MTSSTTHLSILRDRAKGLKPIRRILAVVLLEFIITRFGEVVTTGVPLERESVLKQGVIRRSYIELKDFPM